MKFLLDLLPLALFFTVFKLSNIYNATLAAIAATFLAVGISWIWLRKVEPMQWFTLGLLIVLGGATILFKDETFIKFKPSVVYWGMAIALLVSHFTKKPLLQRGLGNTMELPSTQWRILNTVWAVFFTVMGGINLWVAYNFDTATWVNFKVFGAMSITLVFVLAQAFVLSRFTSES